MATPPDRSIPARSIPARSIPARSRRRGSAILYAIVIAFATTVVAVAGFEVAGSARAMQSRREADTRMGYVAAAAEANFQSRALSTPLLAMNAQSITVGGVSYNLTYAQGAGTKEIAVTIKRSGVVVGTTTVTDPRGAGLQLYGLVTKDLDMDKRLVLGSSTTPTHAYFGKDPSKNPVAGSYIYGAVDAGDNNPKYDSYDAVSTGRGWTDPASCRRLVWVPSESSIGAATINGRTVSGYDSGYSYLITTGGKATVTGTFRGRITIFGGSGVILKAPIVVTAGSELVVMTDSDSDVQGTGEIDCHFYSSAKLTIPNSAGTIDWTGSIVAKSINCKTALNLTLDPFFYGDSGSVEDFYLPAN